MMLHFSSQCELEIDSNTNHAHDEENAVQKT